jgi:23S rRNA pseudouridine2605 synthase
MLANCGHPVVELRRERHGEVELGDLKVGEFREATEEELEWARTLIE